MRIFATSLAALAALVFVFVPNGAGADSAKRGGATIEGTFEDDRIDYVGDATVAEGSTLTVVNHIDPNEIGGGHIFTLAKKKDIPHGEEERKSCGHYNGICKKIRRAHGEIPRGNFVFNPSDVENGASGWDKSWAKGGSVKGDSSAIPSENDEASRVVSAPAGKTLYFFCSIYPRMQGKITVVEP